MWRIEASGEGKSLWPHEQLTCWRCWKTRLIDPRQVRSSSGFDVNFPDDSPLPCFVPPGWLTALIYSLLITSKVNWEGNNIKYEPHLNMVAVTISITHLPVEFSGSRCQLRGRWGVWSQLSYSLPLCLSLLFPFQNFFAAFDVPVMLVSFHRFDPWEQLGGGFARGPLFYFNLQPIRQLSEWWSLPKITF